MHNIINEHNKRVAKRRKNPDYTFIGGLVIGIIIGLTISAVFIDIMILK